MTNQLTRGRQPLNWQVASVAALASILISLAALLAAFLFPPSLAGGFQSTQVRTPSARPAEWTQWRGTNRDGRFSDTSPPPGWPGKLSKLWERDVGGGYSGPVVSGDRVWIHSRRGEQEVVSGLKLASGEVIWTKSYDAPFRQDEAARGHGQGPYSTPSISDGRLFTYGITGILSVWDAATGTLLWRRESGREFSNAFPFFGAAASPLVWEQLCFIHLGGDDRRRPDSPGTGAMVALRAADGDEQWRWAGDGPAIGASPVIGRIGSSTQLIFKSRRRVIGLDPRSGRELWQFTFRVDQDNAIVSPLILGDRLVISDYQFGVRAWQIRSDGGQWTAQALWNTHDASMWMSSPVLAGGIVVGFSHLRKGQLFFLDPMNGELLWRGEPRSGDHATLVLYGNHLLVFREDGWLEIGEISRFNFRSLRKYSLGESICWAHPALVDDRILVRDGARLIAYRLSD